MECHQFGTLDKLKGHINGEFGVINVQDWSFQCHVNMIWAFKIYLSQNNPSKRNPKLKMEMSLEVLNIVYMPREPTSVREL